LRLAELALDEIELFALEAAVGPDDEECVEVQGLYEFDYRVVYVVDLVVHDFESVFGVVPPERDERVA